MVKSAAKSLSAFKRPLIALVLPLALFEVLRRSPYDAMFVGPKFHFYVVSTVSLLAVAIGIAIGVAGNRLRNIKVSFLALSFISLAGLFTVHGLTTPGFLHGTSNMAGFSAQLSVLFASAWLALSTIPADWLPMRAMARGQRRLVPIWTTLMLAFCTFSLANPHIFDHTNVNDFSTKVVFTIVIIALNIAAILSYWQGYRYSKFPLQIVIVYSCCLFIDAQVIMMFGEQWRLSWWLYHVWLLAAIVLIIVGLFKQFGTNTSIAASIQAMFATDPVERVTSALPPSVKSLIMATESKDVYTAGHNFRVTIYALSIAEELGLPPEMRRALVMGTIVHDVGKIRIPDEILNKPGRLTPEERAVIEQHPVIGYEMCRTLGFLQDELDVIRHHHEKWDGTGYPDGLRGGDIPLLARIAAVADVYDALTSSRSYRQAWSHEQTLEYLRKETGTHFDPVCVKAWISVCERHPQVYLQFSGSRNELDLYRTYRPLREGTLSGG